MLIGSITSHAVPFSKEAKKTTNRNNFKEKKIFVENRISRKKPFQKLPLSIDYPTEHFTISKPQNLPTEKMHAALIS